MNIPKILISVAATPVLQAMLKLIGLLQLKPMSHWNWPETLATAATFIVAAASAAVVSLWTPPSNRAKAVWLVIGIGVFVAALGVYTWLSAMPPDRELLLVYDIGSYVTFFLTYIAFGSVVARTVDFFVH